jgi:CheY-like chemotaxis protein
VAAAAAPARPVVAPAPAAAPPQPISAPAPAAAPPQAAAPQVAPPGHAAAAPATPSDPAQEPPIDRERLVVVADPDVETGKILMSALASWGLQPVLVHDGVEALLTIQRMLPRAAILDAALPKMYGFQICEMVKRNESLRAMRVVLVGSVHHQDRYRRPPTDTYGADAYMEKPELPDGLASVLQRFGYPLSGGPQPSQPPVSAAPPAPQPEAAAPPQAVAPPQAAAPAPAPAATQAPSQEAAADDGLAEQRANAERLARIIVSDILLYHPEQFEEGMASGQLAVALESAIAEGRGFFAQRVDARVRDERDFIMDELERVAQQRAGQ